MQKRTYHRHLPHQVPEGFPIFLTWTLKGAIPRQVVQRLHTERDRLQSEPKRLKESSTDRKIRHSKLVFSMSDQYLAQCESGPKHLKDSQTAAIVENSILFGAQTRYDLFAFVVMSNHVHVLLTPHWPLEKITQGIKGFTAKQINKMHNAQNRIFWQSESYDHWPRDDDEFYRIIDYIERNPVDAGLCVEPKDWSWSSASKRKNWSLGQAFQADMLN